MKPCSLCLEEKPTTEYHWYTDQKGIYRPRARCKDCTREAARIRGRTPEYRAYRKAYQSRPAFRTMNNTYRKQHQAKATARATERYKLEPKYKARKAEIAKQTRKRHPDKVRARMKAWVAANRDRVRALGRAWGKRNRRKTAEYCRRYDARKRGATRVETVDRATIIERDQRICHICRTVVVDDKLIDLDHVIPLSKGGTHTADNIRVAHAVCNRRKGAKLLSGVV